MIFYKHLLTITLLLLATETDALDFKSLPQQLRSQLISGKVVLLDHRPGEKTNVDKRFVTMAKLISATRTEIWEVVIDKDNADKFLDGVMESRIVKKGSNQMVVDQKTRVGGPKGYYRYTLRYHLVPETRADFSFIKGDIKNVLGGWWILDGPNPEQKLVIYSLHIDPGLFAPQFVVKKGMKKTLPETLLSTEQEIQRRRKE